MKDLVANRSPYRTVLRENAMNSDSGYSSPQTNNTRSPRKAINMKIVLDSDSGYNSPQSYDIRYPHTVNPRDNTASALLFDATTQTSYIRGSFLGKGGFAKCYELVNRRTGKRQAGKIVPKSRIAKAHQKEKMVREIELHRGLRHKHVVGFDGYFEDSQNVYIMLEYCSKKSLVEVLKKRKTLTEPEVRYYTKQLVLGCKYIHSQKIVHRDLKLGNMLLNESMELKIADFGLAARIDFEGERKMTVCGTPNYIAPEVLGKKGHSYSADIWAIGCTVYAMLVGRPPFETSSLKETYMRIANNQYSIPSHLSLSARNLIRKCLSPNPDIRPSLDEILVDDFLATGFLPKLLPPECSEKAPKFPVVDTLLRSDHTATLNIRDQHRTTNNVMAIHPKVQLRSPTHTNMPSSKIGSKVVTRETIQDSVRNHVSDATGFKAGNAMIMCSEIVTCLEMMPSAGTTSTSPQQVESSDDVWIMKWVDYTNKYGFGFQLSDRTVGVLFNDTSRISLCADTRTIIYHDVTDNPSIFSTDSVPVKLEDKATLLLYFSSYMDEHLIKGGDLTSQQHASTTPPQQTDLSSHIYMKKWFRTSEAIVMYLSNGTLQVNFFEDHTKVIVGGESNTGYLVTYINEDRVSHSYWLNDLKQHGCAHEIRERLNYVREMLHRLINIEGNHV